MRLQLPSWVSVKCPVKYLLGAVSTCMCLNPLNFACFFFCLNDREECLRTVSKHLHPGQISWPPTTLAQHEKDISDCEKCSKQKRRSSHTFGWPGARRDNKPGQRETHRDGPKSSRQCWHDERQLLNGSFHRSLDYELHFFFLKAAIITCKQGLNFDFYTCKVNSCRFVERQRFIAVSRG